jgi:hypothetical protein
MFCLRCRLNRDLSPFRADIMTPFVIQRLVPDNHNFPVGCLSADGPADLPKIIGEAANSARVAMLSMEVRTSDN